MLSFINFPLAFMAGMVAAFNPCGIVLLPSYITHLLSAEKLVQNKKRILLFSGLKIGLSMTAGFSFIFLLIGTAVSLLGFFLNSILPWISVTMGLLLLFVGLIILIKPGKMGSIISISNLGNRLKGKKPANTFLYGIGYGLVSLGCTLPIFMMVVFTGFSAGNFREGLLNFILYGSGMGTVITVISLLSLLARKTIDRWLNRLMNQMERVTGLFLSLAGIYLLYYWLWGPGSWQLF